MITLSNVSKKFGTKILFDGVTLTFNPERRYALTGPNGAGKTTLLKIIMQIVDPDGGTVTLPDKVGILKQNIEDFADMAVLDCVIMGNKRLWEALKERDKLYDEEMTDEIGMRLGDLEGVIADEDGYSAESNAEVILDGMGIPHEYFSMKMKEIPTDTQFKVLLCQALFGNPQALLLDEPTNHLDLESIGWLEKFLHDYKGTVIVISHDRHFLNSVATHVADIDYETIILYPGNYDEMVYTKTQVRDREMADAKSKEKKIAQLKDFVAKFGAGTRASQVQSRMREIDRLQPQELKQSNIQRPYIRFIPNEKTPGQIVMKVEGISKSYEDLKVIEKFNLEIQRGDKIGVIGANGLGKSTLVKMLAKQIEQDRGKLEWGHNLLVSYFPQNHGDMVDKKTDMNAFDWLKARRPGVYDQDIRSVMGKMLFSGDDAFKKVSALSGGETARLILAGMMLEEHNTLILDEPNGHLDLEAVSALGWGLNEYKGTVVVVTHDRDLITTVATKIVAFEPDGIKVYNGKYEEYLASKGKK